MATTPDRPETSRSATGRFPWVWDYDIDEATFVRILRGETSVGRLDRDWAAVRLIEYAPYEEIVRLLGFRDLLGGWPRWRARIKSVSRRRGIDFLAEWLPRAHPERLEPERPAAG